MAVIGSIFGWLFAVIFGLLCISMVLMGNWIPALVLLLAVLLCLPPVSILVKNQLDLNIPPGLRIILILALLFGFVRLMIGEELTSIYASPEIEAQFYDLYDQKMTEWPVPYEDVFLDTGYGQVHVIVSGPPDASAMLLMHASGISSWSWKFNAAALSENYRIYAIDTLGDVGKSKYADFDYVLKDGKDQADLYAKIADLLGVDKAYLVGASDGGALASYFALNYPERVEKVVLLGPMGYSGATRSIISIMFAQFFPLEPVRQATFKWAFSNSQKLIDEFGDWFTLTMTGYTGGAIRVAPSKLSAEQRQSFQVPILFIFGTRDNLVGNPQAARELVQDVPGVKVKIIEAGHLMGGEAPEVCNQLILDFFGEE